MKYLGPVQELVSPDRYTLEVNFDDVEKHNQNLATTIVEEYYRYVKYIYRHTEKNILVNFRINWW